MNIGALKPVADQSLSASVLLLTIALAYQLAQISLSAFAPLPTATSDVQKLSSTSRSEGNLPQDVEEIMSWKIFGDFSHPKEASTIQEPVNVDAPETKLALTLQGVSLGADQDSSSAIISESKGGGGELYWVGDSILGKATLSSVHENKVVIKQNGRLESLFFSEEFKSANLGASKRDNHSSRGSIDNSNMLRSYRSRNNQSRSMLREVGSALNDVSQGNFEAYEALLDQYGADLERNIDSIVRGAGLEETNDGFKFGSSSQRGFMNKVGLRPGDVVRSVNNYPVTTLKSDRSALDTVMKSCVARIEVLRGKNTFVLTYPFCK